MLLEKPDWPYISRVLQEQCQQQRTAEVTIPHRGPSFPARFHSLAPDVVTLQILESSAVGLEIPSPCIVSFVEELHPRNFISRVTQREALPEGIRLVVELPTHIFPAEYRRASRFPVEDTNLLAVHVTHEAFTWKARVLDISLCGICLEIDPLHDPQWQVDQRLKVVLELAEWRAELAAVIKRQHANRYGLFFPEVFFGTELRPPEEFHRIVEILAREWFQRKLQG